MQSLMNTAIVEAQDAEKMAEGMKLATDALESGRAQQTLEKLIRCSQE